MQNTTILDLLDEDVAERLIALGDDEIDTALTVTYDLDVYDEASVRELAAEFTASTHAGEAMSHEHALEEMGHDEPAAEINCQQNLAEIEAHPAKRQPTGYDLPALPIVAHKATDLAKQAIEVEGEALIEVACAGGCGDNVLIDPQPVPDEVAHLPRVPACKECVKDMTAGKTGHVVRTPRVKKHQWRTEATPQELASADAKRVSEEEPMIDLSKFTDAQLGSMVRESLLKRAAGEVRVSKAAAEIDKAAAELDKPKATKKAKRTATVAVVEVDPAAATTQRKIDTLAKMPGWNVERATAYVTSL